MKYMSLDLETTINSKHHGGHAKDPLNDFVTIIACSKEVSYVKHNAQGFKRVLDDTAIAMINDADVIIGHNLPFDLAYVIDNKCIQEFILRGGNFWCSQVAEYLMSGQMHSYASLAELQNIYLGSKIKKDRISKLFSKSIGADKIIQASRRCPRLFKLFDQYCYDDGETTLQIFEHQFQRAKKLGMLDIIKMYNKYMVSLVISSMSGIHVDMDLCAKTNAQFKIEAEQALEEAKALVAPLWDSRVGEFNINSPKDKSAVLFGGEYDVKIRVEDGLYKNGNVKYKTATEKVHIKGFGLPLGLTKTTAFDGRFATGHDVIENVYHKTDNELAKKYCELQRKAMNLGKMSSTFLEAFLTKSINGKLHPNFNNTQTITGRLSSSNPNLQNVPSKGDMGNIIQQQLVAPPGWVCVSADYSQLEIYVLAYLTQDKALTNDLLSGVDFHVKRLAYAENMTYDEVYKLCKIDKADGWDLKRSKAKTISYQKAYGASPKKLAESTGLPEAVIQQIFDAEDIEYADVKEFYKGVMSQVATTKSLSLSKHLPKNKKLGGKNGKRFVGGIELLPIIDNYGNITYNNNELRNIGYYISVTGKRYAFEEIGRINKYRKLNKGFSHTQTKNYMVQGTAADVQAASSAKLITLLLRNPEKIKFVNEIHDSKLFYVKEEYLQRILPIIKEIMEDVPRNFKEMLKLDVPFRFPIDFKIGPNFGDLEDYKL